MAWVNAFVLIGSMFAYAWLYVRSVRPARLALRVGPGAYQVCAHYRLVAMVFMFVAMGCFVLSYLLPLPLPIPQVFPWPKLLSILLGLVLAVPATYFVLRGVRDAGEEALTPKPEHGMFGGIYRRMRHPQAWEAAYWFVLAFWLNSPFLLSVSFLGLGLEYWMVMSEEDDLRLRFGESYAVYRRRTPAFLPRRARPEASVEPSIREEQPGDESGIRTVLRQAFQGEEEADLVDRLRGRHVYRISLVAVQEGEIVGHILFTKVSIGGGRPDREAVALGPMAVAPTRQGQGVGSLLVREGVEACRLEGHSLIFVLGHPWFYPKFGFVPASSLGFRWEHEAPEEAFMALVFDYSAGPGPGGVVRFSPEFDGV
jgi:predicted N-acetyltransferase YhbS/protein-S-isoprenylcysteine O-methyltransferase Ste14